MQIGNILDIIIEHLKAIFYRIKNIFRFHETISLYDNVYLTKHSGDLLMKHLSNKFDFQDKKLLEVGSGEGYLFDNFKYLKHKPSYYTIEFHEETIELLKRRIGYKSLYKESWLLDKIPVKLKINQKFDFIIITEVLMHIDEKHKKPLLIYLQSLLKKTGKIIIVLPTNDNENVRYHEYAEGLCSLSTEVRNYSFNSFVDYLREKGIKTPISIEQVEFYVKNKGYGAFDYLIAVINAE
jgi:2-polyprenyl-3-methyl-5-hydroxy-6-metoxy-1,4-benzoquinol methylase